MSSAVAAVDGGVNVVPVQLGCCPAGDRCDLCVPRQVPEADVISALVEAYEDRDGLLTVAFFGGAPPSEAQLSAIGSQPFTVRVRPDLLDRAGARRLADRGCERIELDALSLHDPSVRAVARRHRAGLVLEMQRGIQALGMQAGVVLAPGLPGSSHELAVEDAGRCSGFDTVRIHPVLVIQGSLLQQAHMDGRYIPLTLAQAVTTCRAMLDVLDDAGVQVLRVGQNAGPDGLGHAVAGPHHSSLRELVEARRTLDVLLGQVDGLAPGHAVTIRCAPADETRTRGPRNQHVRTLRAHGRFTSVVVQPDPSLARGQWTVDAERETCTPGLAPRGTE